MLLHREKTIEKCEEQLLEIIKFLDNEFTKANQKELNTNTFFISNYIVKYIYNHGYVSIEKENNKFVYNAYASTAYVVDDSLNIYGEFKIKFDDTIESNNIKAKSLYFIEELYKLLIEKEKQPPVGAFL